MGIEHVENDPPPFFFDSAGEGGGVVVWQFMSSQILRQQYSFSSNFSTDHLF